MIRMTNRYSLRVRAFTLVEMLVAVAISTIIIISLYAVFNQTQKAFRSTINQVDTLEGGRAAMEIAKNDLQHITPSGVWNFRNFSAIPVRGPEVIGEVNNPPAQRQLVTNILQELLFLTKANNKAEFIGYRFYDPDDDGIATLMRFSHSTNFAKLKIHTNNILNDPATGVNGMFVRPVMDANTNSINGFQKVLDGVVHFRVIPYDEYGYEWTPDRAAVTNLNSVTPMITVTNDTKLGIPSYYFDNDKAPAFLDLELGVLDPQVVKRLQGQPAPARQNIYNREAGSIHLFRERIEISPQR